MVVTQICFFWWLYKMFCKRAFHVLRLQPARWRYKKLASQSAFLSFAATSRYGHAVFAASLEDTVNERHTAFVNLTALSAPDLEDILTYATEAELERELKKRRRRKRLRGIFKSSGSEGSS